MKWHHNFQHSIWACSWSKIVQSPCKLAVREWLNKCVYSFWTRVCIKVPGQLNRSKPNGQGLTPSPSCQYLVYSLNGAWPRYDWHFFKRFYYICVVQYQHVRHVCYHIITREVSVTHAMKLMVQFVGKIYRVTTHDVHAHNVQYL